MSADRLATNRGFFLRDLLRDYCAVYLAIAEQLRRYRRDGNVSYTVINALIGESMSKGVFWRLKDNAHYLFRNGASAEPEGSVGESGDSGDRFAVTGRYIDWCVGYCFHECRKLREDAFQGQHYAMRLVQLVRDDGGNPNVPLKPLLAQTSESCKRELNRILRVLRSGMSLLTQYLPLASDNCSLARWLVTEQAKARSAFGPYYKDLLLALYGDRPERMYTLAAEDLLECGRAGETVDLLTAAWERGQLDDDGKRLLALALRSAEENVSSVDEGEAVL